MNVTAEQRLMVADAIAKQIEHLGTNAEAVARAADLSGNTVRRVLAGVSWPTVATRTRLELALAWSPGSFVRLAIRGDQATGLEGYSDHDLAVEQLRRSHERARIAGN